MTEKGTKRIDWEVGVDRLADLELMPDQEDKTAAMSGKAIMGNTDGTKTVVYNEVWNQYHMCFSLFLDPFDDPSDEYTMENEKNIEASVSKMPRPFHWMYPKYGKIAQPIQFVFPME